MIINTDILRRDTLALLKQIDAQIDEIQAEASMLDLPPEKLRDAYGNWVMGPLLLAKVQAYAILVQLQAKS